MYHNVRVSRRPRPRDGTVTANSFLVLVGFPVQNHHGRLRIGRDPPGGPGRGQQGGLPRGRPRPRAVHGQAEHRRAGVRFGPRPFLTLGWMEPHLLPAWTRYVNDMIHQQCAMFPDRFLGAAMLPQVSDAPDLSHCLDELNRCVTELGFRPPRTCRRTRAAGGRPRDARGVLVPGVRASPGTRHAADRARHEALDPRCRWYRTTAGSASWPGKSLAGQFLSHGTPSTASPSSRSSSSPLQQHARPVHPV